MKKMQVSSEFFDGVEVLISWLDEYGYDETAQALCYKLSEEITDKRNAMARREAFTAYKVAEHGTEERERWRNEYLDRAGITRKFRSVQEVIDRPPES
jgi:hypothetical protein